MPESNSSLIATLALITKAIEIGGDILPVALRAYAALKADHTDEEFIALARETNDLDEQKIHDLIAKAGG
jgi:hypothetical protein